MADRERELERKALNEDARHGGLEREVPDALGDLVQGLGFRTKGLGIRV